jgi:peptide/nickel transport system substrate-binding protein
MRRSLKRPAGVVVAVAAIALAAACGSSSSGGSSPSKSGNNLSAFGFNGNVSGNNVDTLNTGTPKKGGTLTATIEKNITDWNILSASGATEDTVYVMNAIWPSVYNIAPSNALVLNNDLVQSATQTSASPQTVVFKLNPKAVWSDGSPINANDFIFAWRTQDTNICKTCQAASGGVGFNNIQSVTGSDNGDTVTVVFSKPFADWKGLFTLMPSHLVTADPATASDAVLANGFNVTLDKQPTVSGGAYVLSQFTSNQSAVETPNPKWYGNNDGPYLDKLIFSIITDSTQMPTELANHEVDVIFPQPEVDLLNNVKAISGVDYDLLNGPAWEHIDFNLKDPSSPIANPTYGKALRQALLTATDVKGMIARTVGAFDPGVKPLDNRMIFPGQPGYQDNIGSSGLGSGDITKAKQILTTAGFTGVGTALKAPDGTTVRPLVMRYTVGNTIRQTECQLFANAAQQLGVKVNVETTDDLGGSLTHQAGHDYDVIVFAFVGGPFLLQNQEIWDSHDFEPAGENYGHYSDPAVDAALEDAANQTDYTKIEADDNKADQAITADAWSLPLYQKPSFIAYYPDVVNVRNNGSSSGYSYNDNMWGKTD